MGFGVLVTGVEFWNTFPCVWVSALHTLPCESVMGEDDPHAMRTWAERLRVKNRNRTEGLKIMGSSLSRDRMRKGRTAMVRWNLGAARTLPR